MVFADLKNDFVFRKIFATHPEILRGLLNDLLDRTGDQAIESLEYLPSEQLPQIPGLKLSILDVRCRERSGVVFIVEMQLFHVAGFMNRVVYNGSKAYVNQLKAGDSYTKLVDVVAIAICDFELWPNAEQERLKQPYMPMLSRFAMAEETTGNRKLLQVQYAFLELPKVPKEIPAGGAALWAWLFVHGHQLPALPDDLPQGPMREAMELAKEASFSAMELEAYRKVMDEIQQARDFGETKRAEGLAEGLAKGHEAGLSEGHKAGLSEGHKAGLSEGHKAGLSEGRSAALTTILSARGFAVTDAIRKRIIQCKDPAQLDRWLQRVITAPSIDAVFVQDE